jgi:hypothetical protein
MGADQLLGLIKDPKRTSKRVAFAALRSLENFVSKAWSYSWGVLEEFAEKTKDRVVGPASRVIALVLLGLALDGAVGIGPVAGKINEMRWVQDARALVEAQIARWRKGE